MDDSGDYRAEKDPDNLEGGQTEESRGVYDSQTAELGDAGVSLAAEESTQPTTELTSTAWGQYVGEFSSEIVVVCVSFVCVLTIRSYATIVWRCALIYLNILSRAWWQLCYLIYSLFP